MKSNDTTILTGSLLLANGERIEFSASDDADAAQSIVTQIASGRLFSRPNLIIAAARSLLISRMSNVVRLDLQGDGLDNLLLLDGLGANVKRTEITQEEWEGRALRSEISDKTRLDIVGTPGKAAG